MIVLLFVIEKCLSKPNKEKKNEGCYFTEEFPNLKIKKNVSLQENSAPLDCKTVDNKMTHMQKANEPGGKVNVRDGKSNGFVILIFIGNKTIK